MRCNTSIKVSLQDGNSLNCPLLSVSFLCIYLFLILQFYMFNNMFQVSMKDEYTYLQHIHLQKIVQTECNKNLFLIAEVQPILCKDNHSKQKNDKNYNIFYRIMAKNSNLPDFSQKVANFLIEIRQLSQNSHRKVWRNG